jgi:hypothetical protein
VDLVEEEEGGPSRGLALPVRTIDDGAHVLHASEHRRQRNEGDLEVIGEQAGECRLAGSGRTPQDQGVWSTTVQKFAQKPSGAQEMLLADDILDHKGAHALGQRCIRSRF